MYSRPSMLFAIRECNEYLGGLLKRKQLRAELWLLGWLISLKFVPRSHLLRYFRGQLYLTRLIRQLVLATVEWTLVHFEYNQRDDRDVNL